MRAKYKIYPERNLLVDIVEGSVELSDLEKLHGHELANENIKYVKKVLSIVVNSEVKFSHKDLGKYIDILIKTNPDPSIRWAILTSTPMQTAFSFLLKDEIRFNHIVDVFSTLDGCVGFLGIYFDHKEFNDEDYIIVD